MRPVVSEVALEYRDVFTVAKLEVNDNPVQTAAYQIRGTPTYILFYKGKMVKRFGGAMPKASLVDMVLEGLISVIAPPLTQEETDSE